MTEAYLALGSNLGNREEYLSFALHELRSSTELDFIAATPPIETKPLGGLDQPDYLNAMIRCEWSGTPGELLELCHRVEAKAGRVRRGKWESRVLDIDLVIFGDTVSDGSDLKLPHPGLTDREFWKQQIAELGHNE